MKNSALKTLVWITGLLIGLAVISSSCTDDDPLPEPISPLLKYEGTYYIHYHYYIAYSDGSSYDADQDWLTEVWEDEDAPGTMLFLMNGDTLDYAVDSLGRFDGYTHTCYTFGGHFTDSTVYWAREFRLNGVQCGMGVMSSISEYSGEKL